MGCHRLPLIATLLFLILMPTVAMTQQFSGGGLSIYLGTGWPNSIDAATELATDLDLNDESGNLVFGVQGFYQGNRYRLGGAFQGHGWAGFTNGKDGTDGAAGVAALVGGLYATYTGRHDRVLFNVGTIFGAGRCFLGYDLETDNVDRHESVTTFFLEPQVSLGVAACRWFGVEFQLSMPVFILTDDLTFTDGGKTYTVDSEEMMGVNFCIKLTFGKIADLI